MQGNWMRKAFFALMFFLALSTASAVELSVPENVPENANWSLFASFGEASYDKIQVFLDNERVYETSWGSEYINFEIVVSARYYDIEKKLAISFAGLKEGIHTVKIRILREGTETDSVSREFEVFKAGSMDILNQTKENFASMRNSLKKLREEVDSGLETVNSFNASLEKMKTDISALESDASGREQSIESLKASVSSLENELKALSQNLATLSAGITERDSNVNALLGEIEKSITSIKGKIEEITKPKPLLKGFFSFVQGNPVLAFWLMVLIIVLVILILLKKRRAPGMLFETGEFESEVRETEEPREKGTEKTAGEGKGKWAFGEKAGKGRGFSFGDLLWKKK